MDMIENLIFDKEDDVTTPDEILVWKGSFKLRFSVSGSTESILQLSFLSFSLKNVILIACIQSQSNSI